MKLMKRNLQTIYYATFSDEATVYDEDSLETGEHTLAYATPVALECSVSPEGGTAQTESFGVLDAYSRVVITENMSCPIDEETVLFVDTAPPANSGDPFVYDYIVKRVRKSLNFIAYLIHKVDISAEAEEEEEVTPGGEESNQSEADPG